MDTVSAQLRLPADKLQHLQLLLQEWSDRKTCERRDLESLIGLLHHASKVVRSGRSFLQRMLDLLHGMPMHPLRPHPIQLNQEFRSDLSWWRLFAAAWNGTSYLPFPTTSLSQRWHPTHQGHGVVAHGMATNGSRSSGTRDHRSSQSWSKSCSLSFSLPWHVGVTLSDLSP